MVAKDAIGRKAQKQAVAQAGAVDAPAGELVAMDEAIRILKTTRPTFYRWLRGGRLKGIKAGRQWRFFRADLEHFLKGEEPRIELPVDARPLLKTLCEQAKETGMPDATNGGRPMSQKLVIQMILLGVGLRASDIHLTAHVERGRPGAVAVLRYRIHGVLHAFATFDTHLLPGLVEEWKRMAACNISEKQKPQDGSIKIALKELHPSLPDKPIDLRVASLPAALGETLTVRILDPSTIILDLDRIDYAPQDRERLWRAINGHWGLIAVSGPTGCGKTTTLYSCINAVASPSIKIMTVEDPVEYCLPWTTQVTVNEATGMTFGRAVRAIMRSDPDVLLVGEVRDLQTLNAIEQLALTGHLVLTALHANDAAGALKRMVDIGSDPFVVADATRLILSQRLVRKLCPHCSQEEVPSAGRLDLAAEAARKGGLIWHTLPPGFRKPVGCDRCGRTGYSSRTVIAETLEVTPEIGRALRNNASLEEIRTLAVGQGMTTIAADGVRRAAAGEVSLDEVMGVI